MSQRSMRMFVVLVGLGVASSAWAAGSAAVRTEKAVGPLGSPDDRAVRTQKAVGPLSSGDDRAVRTQKAVGPLGGGVRAVRTEKAVGPLRGSAVHTDKAVGHDEKPAGNGPLLDLNAGF